MALEIKDNFSKVLMKNIFGISQTKLCTYFANKGDKMFMAGGNESYCYKGMRDNYFGSNTAFYGNGGHEMVVNTLTSLYNATYNEKSAGVCAYCGTSNDIGQSSDTGLLGEKVNVGLNISRSENSGTLTYAVIVTNINNKDITIGEFGLFANILPTKSDGTFEDSSSQNGVIAYNHICTVLLARERFDEPLVLGIGESRVISMALRVR